MKIRLLFSCNRETFYIDIKDRILTYKNRRLLKDIQLIPKDPNYKKEIICSRNRIPSYIIQLIEEANTGKNLEEYQSAKNDEELIPIIKWDCANRGCKFEKRMDIEDGA